MAAPFDYQAARLELTQAAADIGNPAPADDTRLGLSPRQLRRFRERNFMTDERWAVRRLRGGSMIVEIAYGWFIDHPLYGLTVFCVRDLKDQADRLDFELSRVTFSIPEAVARLQELDALPAPTMA